MTRTGTMLLSIVMLTATTPSLAGEMGRRKPVEQTDCRVIEEAARANLIPAGLLTHLLWTESHFQTDAVSPKGALGVAQFMPQTADERGLSNPFDPDEAIPQAARLLADLKRQFDNIGLATAAYNAGSKRVNGWLANTEALPRETRNFVISVTGHSPEEWLTMGGFLPAETGSCLALSAFLGTHSFHYREERGRSPRSGDEGFGLLPATKQSGRLLPVAQQSGRVLPAAAQSGRLRGHEGRLSF
jgi:hypothetical protein